MFNKKLVSEIGKDITEAVRAVAEKHGIKIEYGGGSWDTTEVDYKLKAKVVGAETREERAYRELTLFEDGMPALHSVINIKGVYYKILGWNTRAPKYPIKVETPSGAKYKMTVDMVSSARRV